AWAGSVEFPSQHSGYVEKEGDSLSNREAQPVHNHIHLKLEPYQKQALVGISHSGKSTIANLVAKLYDVHRGTVYIDGMDVRNLRLESLRTRVCYLLQDAVLFDRTLKENLLLGNPLAPTKELNRSVEIADMKELLRRL